MTSFRDWKDEYKRKLCTMGDAAKKIQSNDVLALNYGAAEPSRELMDAIAARKEALSNVKVCTGINLQPYKWYEKGYESAFDVDSIYPMAKFVKKSIQEGRSSYLPLNGHCFGQILSEARYKDVKWLFTQVSPANSQGYFTFGLNLFYTKEIASSPNVKVVVEVNDKMPTIYGSDNMIHVSDVACIVEHSFPIVTVPRPEPDDVQTKIGEYVASLMRDGDTFQIGWGGISESVVKTLKKTKLKDLGMHSEMLPGGIEELIELGIVTNGRRTIHKGEFTCTFGLGNQEMYDFTNENHMVKFWSGSYNNDPFVIAKNDNMVAINSSLQVDLTGQICSESIGVIPYSGTGGQLDFAIGSYKSKGGRNIIILTSTAKKGALSRIVPTLLPGAIVTVPRSYAQYVITEYGVASLKGRNLKERAKELISIAHPDFRNDLKAEAKKLNLM